MEEEYSDNFSETNDDEIFDEDEIENAFLDADIDIQKEKQGTKIEDEEENEETEDELEKIFNEEEEEIKNQKEIKGLPKFPVITDFEHSQLINQLSLLIADSKVFIPDEISDEILAITDKTMEIALLWFNMRKRYPIPLSITRRIGKNVQIIDPNEYKCSYEYSSFSEEDTSGGISYFRNFR